MKSLLVLLAAVVLCVHGSDKSHRSEKKSTGHHSRGPRWSSFHQRPGTHMDHLMEDLFHHYHRTVRPCTKMDCKDDAVRVSVGMNMINFELNVAGKEMRTHGWARLGWIDSRLTWDASDYGGITQIRVPQNMLWLPDIYLYNRFEHVSQESFWDQQVLALVMNTGNIVFIPPSVLSSYCDFNGTDSSQNCILKFGSWTYSKNDIDLVMDESYAKTCDLSAYLGTITPEWIFKACTAKVEDKRYPCCPEDYPSLTMTITFEKGNREQERENIREQMEDTEEEEEEEAHAEEEQESFFF